MFSRYFVCLLRHFSMPLSRDEPFHSHSRITTPLSHFRAACRYESRRDEAEEDGSRTLLLLQPSHFTADIFSR